MFNTSRRKRRMEIVFIVGLAVLLILTFIGYAYAAYRIQRPIIDTGGVINQTYLWAESTTINGQTVTHKGVDFSYPLDTDVYAVSSGTVVDLREDVPDGDDTTNDWGNFVLIRHDSRHYDRTTAQWAYVYSMYLHLSQWSVPVTEGTHVNAGDLIGEIDVSSQFFGDDLLWPVS